MVFGDYSQDNYFIRKGRYACGGHPMEQHEGCDDLCAMSHMPEPVIAYHVSDDEFALPCGGDAVVDRAIHAAPLS